MKTKLTDIKKAVQVWGYLNSRFLKQFTVRPVQSNYESFIRFKQQRHRIITPIF
jgi:hypothetical protein